MHDPAHDATELILRETEADVGRVYQQAADEMQKKLNDYWRRYDMKDRIKREHLRKGEITKQEYLEWRKGQLMIGKRWEEMLNALSRDMHNSNNIARSIVVKHMPEVYAINHNYATFQIEKGSMLDTSYTLYDRSTVERIIRDQPDLLPPPGKDLQQRIAANKDIAWQRGKIQSVTLQSILQGESIPKMAKRIAKTMGETNKAATVRYARTAMTGAQNAGRVDAYKRAEGMGIELEQEWLATLDSRTRYSHRYMDGQHVKVGELFSNGCRFPGDPDGPGYEVWNCRCTLVPMVKGVDQSDAPRNSKLGSMSYDEWKDEHKPLQKRQDSMGDFVEPIRPKRVEFSNDDDYQRARDEYRAKRGEYNEKLDSATKATLSDVDFTIEDFKNWASRSGVDIGDGLEQIDGRVLSYSQKTLDDLFARFPEVKSFDFETFEGEILKTGFRVNISDAGMMSANNGLNFNPFYFKNAEDGIRLALVQLTNGFNVRGDASFATFIRHEYGHIAQEYIEERIARRYHSKPNDWRLHFASFDEYKSAQAAYKAERERYRSELLSLVGLRGCSEYSYTNEYELFAEGFADWSSGGTSEFAVAFGKFFKRWYY